MKKIKPLAWWLSMALSVLLSGCQMLSPSARRLDVLFIAYDQGESNAFLRLEQALKDGSINYKILAFGRAAEIFKDHPLKVDNPAPNPEALRNNRGLALPNTTIRQLTSLLNPVIVYSGMASKAQAQLINSFQNRGSYAIAFYDNFDPVSAKEYVRPFLAEVDAPDEFHIPSRATRNGFSEIKKASNSRLTVTGNPVMESWDEIFQRTDAIEIRQKLDIPPSQTVVVFAGGYDNTYEEYFTILVEAAKSLPELLFLVTYHPKTEGSLERRIVQQASARNIWVIEKGLFSTAELSKMAKLVVVHKSSIAAQACYKNKPVLHIAEPGFNNFFIEKQLASLSSDTQNATRMIARLTSQPSGLKTFYSLGVPKHPSQMIVHLLKERLESEASK